jgi:uncharacterized protein (TIGR02452 family)
MTNDWTKLGHETLRILHKGSYTPPSGRTVNIAGALVAAQSATVSYPPDAHLPDPVACGHETKIEVVNETTLEAAARLVSQGQQPGVLNFASPTSPGGGFLQGARAQEESLARSSGLYACLEGQPMYAFHRSEGRRQWLYTGYAVYSPDVPVFRRDDGELLEQPWTCAFLTCAAVIADCATSFYSDAKISSEMRDRVCRVLQIFAYHGHTTLVLGAWGCGAFNNDATMVANHFRDALFGPFRQVFSRIVFAITDWSDERRFIGPFQRALGSRDAS